jgi:hypothetical protein
VIRHPIPWLIDHAPAWIWRPGNLRFIGERTVHFCFGHDGRRTIEIEGREVAVGRRQFLGASADRR